MDKEFVIVRYINDRPYFFKEIDDQDRAVWNVDFNDSFLFESENQARKEAEDSVLQHYKIEPLKIYNIKKE